ncbi:MAG: 2-amino-4-hydroxy-6-hydroxymethyldihydropteridine diphosphokinase [Armatimonadetes bacterium]|nr:2-amino-4-hydroxy-6-hydroxymethyldihydropteridine diphosphokinase [Armatimonadota bacterium]NIM24399.1 2-amino-4-hydroxy-6-hydroxymethyldihydropteridine diphosphokinase [Armatimonadota bacterium]NIM68270.1 2-amino-4-hydroxy-6-hydroxymethyldihydropteridine diphosphokinase [Armatimonadota bacterium]NIM76674.1 2-amino-4-hydroxy-6-hydroxymethyldihydropteridine diphosphokinase [Armatimonadota bacterium]NIN06473.1 2-amino-4-hydroxy-6-hydroxymethyldihydropteridine diphosphokinase [Armatimonadota ba
MRVERPEEKTRKRCGYLSLGSNQGKRRENLRKAVTALGKSGRIEVKRISQVYETAPIGEIAQADFLNLVAEIETQLSARELLAETRQIEKEAGRAEGPRWGPRVIDIDILLLGAERVKDEDLTIPHPRMLERAFVMVPLAELEPELILENERAEMIAARLAKEQKIGAGIPL